VQDDVRIEQRNQGIEVTKSCRLEKGIDHLTLVHEILVRDGHIGVSYTASGPARELSCGLGRAVYERRNRFEWLLEHIVQYKSNALCRGQAIEHYEEGEPDGIGHDCFMLGLWSALQAYDGIGNANAHVVFAPQVS